MPQVKAAAIVEILRSGSPQILLAIMATSFGQKIQMPLSLSIYRPAITYSPS
jgi:hypothetical protein